MRTTTLACVTCAALLLGCRTLDAPSSIRTVATIATSGNPEAAVRGIVKGRATAYTRDPRVLVADLRAVKRDYERLEAFLTGRVNGSWGRKETKLPSRTQYVKYTQNYRSRAVVDFDAGQVTVETVDDKDPRASLKSAIVTTLLTPDDPRAVDLFSDKPIALTSSQTPYLLGLVHDASGKSIASPEQAERFADRLLEKAPAERKVESQEGAKVARSVSFPMVANFAGKQAEKYRDVVERFAERYKISPSLVYAIIRTESNFNPYAVSSAPAYGMMQLVPSSGGREAFRHAKGRDEMPSREYLFDPANNIELGTAYLNVLFERELDDITNPVSREYCVISAYNTGPSNVLRAFSRDRVAALNGINSLEPPGVFERLRTNLPYEETRQYLAKVVSYRRQFLTFGH